MDTTDPVIINIAANKIARISILLVTSRLQFFSYPPFIAGFPAGEGWPDR